MHKGSFQCAVEIEGGVALPPGYWPLDNPNKAKGKSTEKAINVALPITRTAQFLQKEHDDMMMHTCVKISDGWQWQINTVMMHIAWRWRTIKVQNSWWRNLFRLDITSNGRSWLSGFWPPLILRINQVHLLERTVRFIWESKDSRSSCWVLGDLLGER